MRKIRFFQRSGYISLDLATGKGEFLRLREGAVLPEGEISPLSLLSVVERIELGAEPVEPLRAELEAWVAAIRGEGPLVVSGADGRDALAVALRIMRRWTCSRPPIRAPWASAAAASWCWTRSAAGWCRSWRAR